MTDTKDKTLPEIGYLYYYPRMEHPTEKFRLDVFISATPTEQHFDVLQFHCFVKNQRGTLERLKVIHPWDYENKFHVCAGIVIMEDRNGKKEEAFVFGGQLKIESQTLQTICTLVSPAPILEISNATPLHKLFTDEIEILLAERKAGFVNQNEYELQLCKLDPFSLYSACLEDLIEKFENVQHKHKVEQYSKFLMFLYSQKRRLKEAGLLSIFAVKLDDIFKNA